MPKVDFYMENGKVVLGKRAEQLDMFGGEKDFMRFAVESKMSVLFSLRKERPELYIPMLELRGYMRAYNRASHRLQKSAEWSEDYHWAEKSMRYAYGKAIMALRKIVKVTS